MHTSNSDGTVIVIGGGIVGLASALELAGRGRAVTVVDRCPIDGGCALGSAGHLVPSHVVPLAAPGAVRDAIAGIVRRDGAVSVRWSADPDLWRWLSRFVRSCTPGAVAGAVPALSALARLSDGIWDEWLDASGQSVAVDGLLDAYRTAPALARAVARADELRHWGVDAEVVDGDRARSLEPALVGPLAGGVLLHGDRNLHPGLALGALIRRVERAGVTLAPCTEVVDVEAVGERIARVRTSGGDIDAGHVVLAAGAWSGRLARRLGERVPVIAGRGLSLTVARPAWGPRRALLLGEDHVAVGPMGDDLRLSAWFLLNDDDRTASAGRLDALERIARRRLRIDDRLVVRRRWAGLRPVTPDGVPIIGPSTRWANVTIATGHAMTGLTLGPGTGRLVAQLVCGRRPAIALDRFSPRRFA
jgi:D-amino-acid dehydrogenase